MLVNMSNLTLLFVLNLICWPLGLSAMSSSEKALYRDRVVEMFFHAYDNYMNHAYPADELMPLSCKGRVRGREPSRGDIDECLGSFSLTLVDSLDTLAILGAIEKFNEAIQLVIRDVKFDADLVVSVFETNIRVLGGLLGGHFAAKLLYNQGHPLLQWYNDELVDLAKQVGDKLLPAFNTSTGIPYARINLRHGINGTNGRITGDTTCTACAGTMLMEFAALSRLTGNPEYELKAHHAMEAIWNKRHKTHDLVGTVINVHNGEWTRKESGVGAGIDSYYEYCLKSYILLGNKVYLKRFTTHYSAVKRFISNGPLLLDVHMNSPSKPSRHMMDALLAFWPGLQVLWGDVDSAINTHNLLYQVIQQHKFLPEAFSTDQTFKPIWPQHPLRPEFIESTYFLYKATGDPYYLDIAKSVIDNLNSYARVKCGFASIRNVKMNTQEDRMDSYVLAETFKYLFLLFAEEGDIPFNMDDFIFTTEAHILPLSLSKLHNISKPRGQFSDPTFSEKFKIPSQCSSIKVPWMETDKFLKLIGKQCTSSRYLFPLSEGIYRKTVTKQIKSDLNLRVLDFSNPEHIVQLKDMGISFEFQGGGKVMLSHNPINAASRIAAREGAELIHEVIKMMQLTGNQNKREVKMLRIIEPKDKKKDFIAGPAQFGPDLGGETQYQVTGKLILPKSPLDGCDMFSDDDEKQIKGNIPLILRGGCMFINKVRNAQRSGAIAAVIYDNNAQSQTNTSSPMFPFSMSGDGTSDVHIPSLFISNKDGLYLISLLHDDELVNVLLTWATIEDLKKHNLSYPNTPPKEGNSVNTKEDLQNSEPTVNKPKSASGISSSHPFMSMFDSGDGESSERCEDESCVDKSKDSMPNHQTVNNNNNP